MELIGFHEWLNIHEVLLNLEYEENVAGEEMHAEVSYSSYNI